MLGIAQRCGQPPLAIYSVPAVIQVLTDRDGMTEDELLGLVAAMEAQSEHPLARAIVGKTVGDIVEVHTPKGERAYEIMKVEYR